MTYKNVFLVLSILFYNGISVIPSQKIEAIESVIVEREVIRSNSMPFEVGEKLSYTVHYGFVNAGKAELLVKSSQKKFSQNANSIKMVGKGWTTGATDWFFKVDDHYETYMDMEKLEALLFIRRVNEGGFIINQDYVFEQDSNRVITQDNKAYEVPDGVQDMLSAFYYARSLDYSSAKENDVFVIPAFVDDKVEFLKIKYKGKERIKTRSGKFNCLKFNPLVLKGRVFEADEDVTVWISDDENKIPILIESKIIVGSIKAELTDYAGLSHPLAKD